MNYLAIDASTEACSVALQVNDKVFSRYDLCPQSHSLQLLPMVDELLKEAGIKLSQCDGLIFGRGPGSFTGVRIGVGVAQGLAFAADLPVVGVSSLQAMAQLAYMQGKVNHSNGQVIATIDARMSEVYNGYFVLDNNNIMQAHLLADQQGEAVSAPEKVHKRIAGIVTTPVYGVGTGWDAYSEQLSSLKSNTGTPDILFPSAEAMLVIGIAELSQGKGVAAENAQPVYVRDTVSWKKLPGRD
ncbi:MAG: tRNA (adenosine(37)-N6)-threonylcarbamoyltransferase complex dimerization subunit type 1 TsaB [Colwellia sp.]|nr:tRNA (adenosine(37)-N6)-threonylcarbamoyltransferase complex dimerization subunit type 1 TsaB [Colwellia sp.]MCW8865560.1 tRNA (adenosine(37)-N6)-threonylcarbamoyltransferase complex dimerization subunit type 1 TsaB [Colwellia sp.]MCW9080193.1 tRNA (adenosine(37)-N6)-threonylcarbamoyltransferase complex dimerization subunit type 1 TsaB [Colwellia sp.]